MNQSLTVAACQLPDIQNDIRQSLKLILEYGLSAEAKGAELVCFPECFLQGYIVNRELTHKLALNLESDEFQSILKYLEAVRPVLVFGIIEACEDKLYNTAVVVQQGELLGYYRKVKLLSGESVFEAGSDYPVFEIGKFRFGINICYDMNFPECAAALAAQDAHLLVCPSNNMMRFQTAEKWKFKHNESRSQRAIESGLYILSSDVTGERDGRISYGPTALINPNGIVISQVPLLQEGMIIEKIIF